MIATPLRVLVIGAGPAAVAMHMPVLAKMRDAGLLTLALLCDLDALRLAAAKTEFGFQDGSGDAQAAIARTDIDAVYIFGSAQMHEHLGLRALTSGKHLFVEKPVASSFAAACRLADAAAANRRIAVGGHNRRFYAALLAIKVKAGSTRWRYAEAVFHKPETQRGVPFGANTWLTANGIHALDGLLFMMGGLPAEVWSLAQGQAFSALLRWPDGASASFLCNNAAGARHESYVFHAPGETHSLIDATADGVNAEHAAFFAAMRDGNAPPHSIATLAPALYLAELIEQGYQGPVTLPNREAVSRRDHASVTIAAAATPHLTPHLNRLLDRFHIVSLGELCGSAMRPEICGIILDRSSPPLTASQLDKLPGLSIVGVVGLSLARHAPEVLLSRGITVVNASAAYADSVAEFALGLAIVGLRRGFVSHELMRRGGWGSQARPWWQPLRAVARVLNIEPLARRMWHKTQTPGALRGAMRGATRRAGWPRIAPRELAGAQIGLIGWGANAAAFARRLVQCHCEVKVYSEHGEPAEIRASGATPASLQEVLASDVVSLHRGLTPATRHGLGEAELAQLKAGCVLINVARGALIEPNALRRRLLRGDVFACLDTFETEPPPASHPLRKVPNAFLTSHLAGGSEKMLACAAAEVVAKVSAHLSGNASTGVSQDRLRAMT